VGAILVEDAGFAGCDPEGWSLVTSVGTNCRANAGGCALTGGPRVCCDAFDSICDPSSFGQAVLVGDRLGNCGGAVSQWRLFKGFDLSGLAAVELCYDLAEAGATAASGLLVYAGDGSDPYRAQIDCLNGGAVAGVDNLFLTRCVGLPAWAQGNPAVTITFVAHSDADGEAIYLDNIRLGGWSGACSPASSVALIETFAGCDTSGWNFSVGSPNCVMAGCANQPGWQPGVFSSGASLTMERQVDVSALDGGVEVCLALGSNGPQPADGIRFSFDSGGGFRSAWERVGPLGPDGECLEQCVNLSALDPAVANHPALGLRIEIDGAATVGLYGVRVRGDTYCPADPLQLALTPLAGDGGGNYSFDASDVGAVQLGARVRCQWDPLPSKRAAQSIWFMP
jgi:hypothetical protein